MKFDAQVLADSVSHAGIRLTTMLLTYPRFIHAEFMTHRVFSRNAASSRAIPVKKKIARIRESMVYPVEWGKNQKGMQASELLSPEAEKVAKFLWENAGHYCLTAAEKLDDLAVHKQIANRILEPWDWMTTIVTSTRWKNFDVLRQHTAADPNIQKLANLRKEVYDASTPKFLAHGEWHLPWIGDDDLHLPLEDRKRVSAGRCARVSYLTHEGKRDPQEDINLFKRLADRPPDSREPGHWTPLEHQATPIPGFSIRGLEGLDVDNWHCPWCLGAATKKLVYFGLVGLVCMHCAQGHITSGNLVGWTQFRKEFPNEDFDA